MKSFLPLLFTLLSALLIFPVLAQNKIASVQLQETGLQNSELNNKFKKYSVWKINSVTNVNDQSNILQLHFGARTLSYIVKSNNDLTNEDFTISAGGKQFLQDASLVHLNTGKAAENECHISIAKNFILGSFTIGGEEFVIEQVINFITEADKNLVLVYNIKDEIISDVRCGTNSVNDTQRELPSADSSTQTTNGICRVIDYAIAVDYSSFQNHGSSIEQTSNYILSIMNMVEGNYVGVFTDDLYYKISEIVIFTSPQVNPWVFNADISANLNLFTAWAPTGFTKPFDNASYWYTQAGSFQPIGFAWMNTTCATNGYNTNVIRETGLSSNTTRQLVAHEIGHNFGCGHTSGFIMHATVNNATTWAPESITTINTRIAGSGGACITACNYVTCENLVTPNVTVTENGRQLIVNWTASANPTKVEYRNSTAGLFTLVGTYNSPTNLATINHNPNCNVAEYFQIKVTNICPNTNTGVPTIIVKQSIGGNPPTPTIAIVTTASNQCSATFAATISNGGTTPIFQWKVNGQTVGTNSNSFTSVNLGNNDTISCILTSSLSCTTENNVTSNSIIFQGPTPIISISSNNTVLCGGANTTFNATITNGGNSPIYQWKVNGVNVGANSNTFSTATLNHNDIVTCVLTSSISCVTANNIISNAITIALTEPISNFSFTKTGLSVNFINSSTCAASYAWDFGDGFNSSIANPTHAYAANGIYNVCLTVTNINGTNQKCRQIPVFNSWTDNMNGTTNGNPNLVTYQNTYCDGESYFNGVTPVYNEYPVIRYDKQLWIPKQGTIEMLVKVQNGYTSFGGSNATSATLFAIDSNGLTKSSFIVGYADGKVAFRRYNSTANTFSDVIATATTFRFNEWHVVSVSYGTAGTSIKVDGTTYATNTTVNFPLNDGHGFLGGANFQDASNWWGIYGFKGWVDKLRVSYTQSDWQLTLANLPPTASISASANNICAPAPVTFTATTNATAANFQWKKNGVNVGNNSNIYTDNNLINGNTISCVITATGGCFNTSPVSSNGITMQVTNPLSPALTISTTKINSCAGETVTFTTSPLHGGATPSFQWKKNGINIATGNDFSTSSLTNGDIISCVMTTSLACVNFATASSNNLQVTVNTIVIPTATIFANATNICAGTNVTFTASSNIANPTYQWKVNNNNSGSNSNIFTSSTLNNNDIVSCTLLTPTTGCYSLNTISSNQISIIVKPLLTPTISITSSDADNILCNGQNVQFSAWASNTGTNPIYQWRLNGINTGTNTTSFILQTPVNNDEVTCVLTSSEGCLVSNNIQSNRSILEVVHVNPIIQKNGFILNAISANTGAIWQWNQDGQPIAGANGNNYLPIIYGNYTVTETFKNCTNTSTPVLLTPLSTNNIILIYPNPASQLLFAQSQSAQIKINAVSIYDASGRLVINQQFNNANLVQINVSNISNAIYLAVFDTNNGQFKTKFIKQ